MRYWINLPRRSPFRHLVTLIGGLLLLVLLLGGCARAARQESWPGLTVVEDTLYVADVSRIVALDAETGSEHWRWFPDTSEDAGVGFYAAPVLDEEHDLLFVSGFGDQTIYALRLGEEPQAVPGLVWTFPGAQEEEGARGQYVSPGAVSDGIYYVGNGDGNLYALRMQDGSLLWSFAADDRIWSTPLIHEGVVYLASLDNHLYAVDASSGAERWRFQAVGAIGGAPLFFEDALWFGDFGDQIYKVDPLTGEVLWQYAGENWFWATPVLDEASGTLYAADVGGNVLAIDAVEERVLWETQVEALFRGRGVLSPAGDVLYLPAHERGIIYAFDTANGQRIPWGDLPETPRRLPGNLERGEERVYAMPILTDAHVLAFDMSNGRLLWQFPAPEGE